VEAATPRPAGGAAGRVLEVHAVSGTEQTLLLGGAPGTVSLGVRVAPAPGHCLWVVPGELQSVGNPPEGLGRQDGVRMVYEPPALVRVPGLRPGRYTLVYGPYHVDVPGGPAVVRVDVPSPGPVVVGPVPVP